MTTFVNVASVLLLSAGSIGIWFSDIPFIDKVVGSFVGLMILSYICNKLSKA